MLMAAVSVVLLAYATLFAFTGVGETEAAPAGQPHFGLASLATEAQNSITDLAKIITKLVTGMFDFSDSASGLLQLLSDGMSKSFVTINNSNNKNNNNTPKHSNVGANTTTSTTKNNASNK